ncbi:MAG: hypothetical protein A3C35_01675 [Omnitrophica bacterium RIFCSPHIGHO2_02_FULL_46_11]|nr:MAG: hypothetical protein A3C35_01675 [Omnitrophica bacterium RIFCSPHIGHO2_02_FULL_46_11]OGW85347.1 MAG: hypothetical protein A3A81_04215 [Omnitrophica bacterium RIFCSPLOWO2_01_FULL_45_10b]
MLKKIGNHVLRIGISALSLAFVFYSVRGEVTEGFSHLRNIDFRFLAIAIILNFISLIPVTYRLGTILAIHRIHLSFQRRYYLWMIGLFFNLFLPSAVGGDIAKAYYLYKDSGKKMVSITSILIDRFFGLMSVIAIGMLAFLFGRQHIDDPKIGRVLFWSAGIIFAGVLLVMSRRFSKPLQAFILSLVPKRFHDRLHRFFQALELYRKRWFDFGAAFGYSLLAQAIFIILVYCLARSIHLELPVALFFLLLPLVSLISMVPSIGGLGVREAAIVYLFRPYTSLDHAVALSLICDLFIYGIGCACGILYAVRGGASIKELERIENMENV